MEEPKMTENKDYKFDHNNYNNDYNYHNENADMNYDGNVNVLDITDLIYYILDNMR